MLPALEYCAISLQDGKTQVNELFIHNVEKNGLRIQMCSGSLLFKASSMPQPIHPKASLDTVLLPTQLIQTLRNLYSKQSLGMDIQKDIRVLTYNYINCRSIVRKETYD